MNLNEITTTSSDFQLEEAMNNSSVAINNLAEALKVAKIERSLELKRIIEERGEFQVGTTKVYLGVKKSAKQANAVDIINEIAQHSDDVFAAITNCLGSNAFKKGATQKLIGKNETLFWDVEDEKVVEKIVKEVNTDYI